MLARPQGKPGNGGQCENYVLEVALPTGLSPRSASRVLKRALGRSHKAGTLTYHSKDGPLTVYQWKAGEQQPAQRPANGL